ncbi:hypothetical protein ABZU32_16175 [Sphaerisporangium sp. NPDC005288]|uniref:hypothetical protein n=1 Tax=Sphaerisporangium sp. NPDC005288 TaxID=3155114 RepID=UPI0033B1A655
MNRLIATTVSAMAGAALLTSPAAAGASTAAPAGPSALVTSTAGSSTTQTSAGTSAATAPAGAVTASVMSTWNYVGDFGTLAKCQLDKAVKRAKGYPVDPVDACYRNGGGYYYLYWA